MNKLRAFIITFVFAALAPLAVQASDMPVKAYLTGPLSGMRPLEQAFNISDYKLLSGYDGDRKIINTFSEKKGKVLLVTFWNRGCLACRSYLNDLDKVQQALGNDNFEVVAIYTGRDTYAAADRTLKHWGATHLTTYRSHHRVLINELVRNPAFNFIGRFPKSLLVAPDGDVVAYTGVRRQWLSEEGKALFTAMADGKV